MTEPGLGYDAERLRGHLAAMRAMLAAPEHRATGVNARDADGNRTEWFSPDAVAFGLYGALYRVTDGDDEWQRNRDRHFLVLELAKLLPDPPKSHALMPFTDSLKHEQLLWMLDTAAKRVA